MLAHSYMVYIQSQNRLLLPDFYWADEVFTFSRSQEQLCHLKLVTFLDQLRHGWMISLYGCHQTLSGAAVSSQKGIIAHQTIR